MAKRTFDVEVSMRAFAVLTIMVWMAPAAARADDSRPPVPLRIDAHGGILVPVEVNGAGPFTFLLDTGAARSIVSRELALEIGAPEAARSEVVTSAGSEMSIVVRLASVALAESRVDNLLAPAIEEARLSHLARGIRGLLGQDFLSAFNYTLDYRHSRLIWGSRVSCEGSDAVQLSAAEGRYVMALQDERGHALRLVPDTGAEMAVLFKDRDLAGKTVVLRGVQGNPRVVRSTTLPAFRMGSARLPEAPAVVAERDDTAADGVLPLHAFASVTFAAGGSCLVPRLR
jgi:predicted aspartyl protease